VGLDRRKPSRHDPAHVAAWGGLDRYFDTTDRVLRARRGRGVIGAEPPSYRPHQQLRLQIPGAEREVARAKLDGARERIAVMPTGSGPRWHYPSTPSWKLILRALIGSRRGVRICLIGKLGTDERTRSSFTADEVARLAAAVPDAINGFDLPIVQQLALVEACDLFIAPHTGFGMAALAVATPRLTISGGSWAEYFFNGVPFYSLLPTPSDSGPTCPTTRRRCCWTTRTARGPAHRA
jgi:ADP-heptose:LPS heptosyltransferase